MNQMTIIIIIIMIIIMIMTIIIILLVTRNHLSNDTAYLGVIPKKKKSKI